MWCSLLLALVTLTSFTQDGAASEQTVNWPGWRGPLGNGSAPSADPPLSWSEDKNLRWKTALPGAGHSSPVVWGHRIFVTAAIPVGEELPPVPDDAPGAHDNAPLTRKQRFVALCVDRGTGEILWQQTARGSGSRKRSESGQRGVWACPAQVAQKRSGARVSSESSDGG